MSSNIKFTTVIVSCLVKHIRFEYLKRTIKGIKEFFGDSCDEIIILFDKVGIDRMTGVDLCITHNNGLGYSFNEGLKRAKNELVLQIEDDWIPHSLFKNVEHGIHNLAYDILKKKKGVVRLYQDPIHSKHISGSQLGVKVCTDPCYHLEIIKANKNDMYNHKTYGYYYSNAPQFKLKSFSTDIGNYLESARPPMVERDIAKKFLASDDYRIFYIFSFFCIIGFDSIRDYSLHHNPPNINYKYEHIHSFGNHHLPGKLIKTASSELVGSSPNTVSSPYDDVFVTLNFHKKVFSYDNLNYFRDVINKRRNHYGEDQDTSISFPDRNLNIPENVDHYLKCIDNLEYLLKSNSSINFLYSIYKNNENDVSASSDTTKEAIDDLYVIKNMIKQNYKCDKISMTIITFEENETYDNDNISYLIQPVENYEDITKVIIKCQNVTHSSWIKMLGKNKKTITNLYIDLHTLD